MIDAIIMPIIGLITASEINLAKIIILIYMI